jgi:hypothetical protein
MEFALAKNFKEYLQGIEKKPHYIFDMSETPKKNYINCKLLDRRWFQKRIETLKL